MRIAILTLPLHSNYGGILQAFALQTVLTQFGNNVVVLQHEWIEARPSRITTVRLTIHLFLKWLLKDKSTIILPQRYLRKNNTKFMEYINEFVDKYINIRNLNTLEDCRNENLDAIVVGSDQVWRPQYFRKMWEKSIDHAFLSFIKDKSIKKIAYACSFGTDKWEYTDAETEVCSKQLREFDLVTCRESSGVDLIYKKMGINAELVLDPTLLLSRETYESIINTYDSSKKDLGIFAYILDESAATQDLLKCISEQKQLAITQTRIKPKVSRKCKRGNIFIYVEDWLKNFRDAQLVVTDSFHACVFSIIFNKPFIVIDNYNRGSARLNSLLSLFNLESHLISGLENFDAHSSYEVDKSAYTTLKNLQNKSIELLRNALTK